MNRAAPESNANAVEFAEAVVEEPDGNHAARPFSACQRGDLLASGH